MRVVNFVSRASFLRPSSHETYASASILIKSQTEKLRWVSSGSRKAGGGVSRCVQSVAKRNGMQQHKVTRKNKWRPPSSGTKGARERGTAPATQRQLTRTRTTCRVIVWPARISQATGIMCASCYSRLSRGSSKRDAVISASAMTGQFARDPIVSFHPRALTEHPEISIAVLLPPPFRFVLVHPGHAVKAESKLTRRV